MRYYDIELIDVNENVENFKFTKVIESDLNCIKTSFMENKDFLDFKSAEGNALLLLKHFRGVMFTEHIETVKTTMQENKEDAVEIGNYKGR